MNAGKVYLAGPYKGAPLSIAVVVPAVAGPSTSAAWQSGYRCGSTRSRPRSVLSPIRSRRWSRACPSTSAICASISIATRSPSTRLAARQSPSRRRSKERADSSRISADRFQIGECAGLGFKPKISLRLKGGTTRTKHPALTVILRPRGGDANLSGISVTFPDSEILDQGHIGTVCTRVQWAADQCPPASVYGTVSATTPLLDNPLTGNVYLRSSSHELPDLVTDLRGPASQPIRLEASGRTDSVKGRLRNTFDFIPDAPLSKVVLRLQGGNKGLLQNNTNICAHPFRASVTFTAHNGRSYGSDPKTIANCNGTGGHARGHRHSRGNQGRR